MYKYVILGAGPAGLTFANKLKDVGETSFVVLEKEAVAGGLCRSQDVDGFPLDIGGGHFLDKKYPEVNEYLFQFMPESEWTLFTRDSRIKINDSMIAHPLEANIWQMDLSDQVAYLKSVAAAGCNTGESMPLKFVDWIYWKLGKKIADDYMIPYNQKMFGENLNVLGTYWLEKLPNVSFEETLLSCLSKKAYGTQPGHTQFYYPKKYGYGELWLRMADRVKDHMKYHSSITQIDFDKMTISDCCGNDYKACNMIVTIPWASVKRLIGMPVSMIEGVKKLQSSSVQIDYQPCNINTDAHWIYVPDSDLAYHRILVRHNFCPGSSGYWTETNVNRIGQMKQTSAFSYLNAYAYPLNTLDKPQIMNRLLKFAKEKKVYGLGRWGEHEHYNSDVTVKRAFELFDKIYEK